MAEWTGTQVTRQAGEWIHWTGQADGADVNSSSGWQDQNAGRWMDGLMDTSAYTQTSWEASGHESRNLCQRSVQRTGLPGKTRSLAAV